MVAPGLSFADWCIEEEAATKHSNYKAFEVAKDTARRRGNRATATVVLSGELLTISQGSNISVEILAAVAVNCLCGSPDLVRIARELID